MCSYREVHEMCYLIKYFTDSFFNTCCPNPEIYENVCSKELTTCVCSKYLLQYLLLQPEIYGNVYGKTCTVTTAKKMGSTSPQYPTFYTSPTLNSTSKISPTLQTNSRSILSSSPMGKRTLFP